MQVKSRKLITTIQDITSWDEIYIWFQKTKPFVKGYDILTSVLPYFVSILQTISCNLPPIHSPSILKMEDVSKCAPDYKTISVR